MRLIVRSFYAVCLATPALGDDMRLMVGLRSTMATAIRDYGYPCPDVKDYLPLEFVEDGRVFKVVCGPLGDFAQGPASVLRVTAYTQGDFTAYPWQETSAGLN